MTDAPTGLDRRPTPLLLWGRAAVLALVVVVAGVVSHASAGGLLPHPAVLALVLVSVTVLGARFLLRPATLARVVALVVVGQGLVHVLLSALAGHRGDEHLAATPPARHHGHGLATGWLAHQADHLAEQGPAMVLAHLLGAVAVGVWLWVGESALWHLVVLRAARSWPVVVAQRGLASLLVALVGAQDRDGAARRGPFEVLLPPADRLAHPVVSRRGPPLFLGS